MVVDHWFDHQISDMVGDIYMVIKDYFTIPECAEFMHVSKSRVQQYINDHPDFPRKRVGGIWIIPKVDLSDWLEKHNRGEGLYANYVR